MAEKQTVEQAVDEYCTLLRRRQIEGSLNNAKKTADILRTLITSKRHPDASSLIEDVRSVGNRIQNAKPVEFSIGNVVRRVLHIIREEAKDKNIDSLTQNPRSMHSKATPEISKPSQSALSAALDREGLNHKGTSYLASLFDVTTANAAAANNNVETDGAIFTGSGSYRGAGFVSGASVREGGAAGDGGDVESVTSMSLSARPRGKQRAPPTWRGRHEVIEAVNELIDELDLIQRALVDCSVEHIHYNEVILTYGHSETTFSFLRNASQGREFQVVVAEGAPTFAGHRMARRLADAGVQTTMIADSAVYAMMARANKVLVGAHAVLANGGIIAPVGMHLVALAARRHQIPFVVLVGLHKLSPLFPHDPEVTYNEFRSPEEVLDFDALGESFEQQEALLNLEPGSAAAAAFLAASASGNSEPTTSSLLTSALSGALAGAAPGSQGGGAGCACAPSKAGTVSHLPGALHVPNPGYDYVPPHLINLFITDQGGYTPSYVYRLLSEYYSKEDYQLSKENGFGRQ